MKKIIFLIILATTVIYGRGQGYTCSNSTQACLDGPMTFDAGVGSGTAGERIGCLYNTPNPAWIAFQVKNPGRINIKITTDPPRDVDFACWGPFSADSISNLHLSGACSQLKTDTLCASHSQSAEANPTDLGGYPIENLVDCSYLTSATEYIHIPAASANEWYIVLVTNYGNQSTQINFINDSTSTGSSNCGFCAAVDEIDSPEVKLFPNPASDILHCTFETIKNRKLSMVDVSGRTIASWESNLRNEAIDIKAFANGVYFLKVEEGQHHYTQKFIIRRD